MNKPLTQEKFEQLCREANQEECLFKEAQTSKSSALDWLAQCTSGEWEEINNRRLAQPKGNLLSIVQSFQKKEENHLSSPEKRAGDLSMCLIYSDKENLEIAMRELIVLFKKSDEVREWKDYFFGIGKEGTAKKAHEILSFWIREASSMEKSLNELNNYKIKTSGYWKPLFIGCI